MMALNWSVNEPASASVSSSRASSAIFSTSVRVMPIQSPISAVDEPEDYRKPARHDQGGRLAARLFGGSPALLQFACDTRILCARGQPIAKTAGQSSIRYAAARTAQADAHLPVCHRPAVDAVAHRAVGVQPQALHHARHGDRNAAALRALDAQLPRLRHGAL